MVLEGAGRPSWVHWLQRPAVLQCLLPRLPLRHHKQPLVIACESVCNAAAIALPACPVGAFQSTVFIVFWLTYSRKKKKKKKCGVSHLCLVETDCLIFVHTHLCFLFRRDGRELKENEEVALKEWSGNMWKGVQTTQPVVITYRPFIPSIPEWSDARSGPKGERNQQEKNKPSAPQMTRLSPFTKHSGQNVAQVAQTLSERGGCDEGKGEWSQKQTTHV